MNETYGTNCSSVTSTDYNFDEPPWFGKGPYKAVTIGEILDAIERGHWVVPK